jgi:Methylamine utilization protein MauJ
VNQGQKRWMVDYRVESELRLEPESRKLKYVHPDGLFEIDISNAPGDAPETENLSVQIVLTAPDITTAEDIAESHLRDFLYLLSFVTSTGYHITRRSCLLDWSPGHPNREGFIYATHSPRDAHEALASSLLETVQMLQQWGTTPALERSLRWYSSGVRSRVMEDQFQCFWFVIELIAQATKGAERVSDKCQKCHGDLRCTSCGELSTHRPFQRQAIELLLSRMGIANTHIADLFLTRNGLLHGATRGTIESQIQARAPAFTFDRIVDLAGKLAWSAILNAFKKPPGEHRPLFLEVNTYVDWHVTGKAHVVLGVGGDSNNPKIEDVHLPQMSFATGKGQKGQ